MMDWVRIVDHGFYSGLYFANVMEGLLQWVDVRWIDVVIIHDQFLELLLGLGLDL